MSVDPMLPEALRCTDCNYRFNYGDSLYFKPIPYLEYMDDREVTMEPYCKYCVLPRPGKIHFKL
jgi:hypothetical protein